MVTVGCTYDANAKPNCSVSGKNVYFGGKLVVARGVTVAMGLDEAWQLAEARSPDLEAATQMTVAADADVGLSHAAWLPKLVESLGAGKDTEQIQAAETILLIAGPPAWSEHA